MIKKRTGFTLIELLLVMAIMGLVLTATSDMFITMLRQYKQQGKIAETNIEGIIGLELLRQDIERAGYGLPWVLPTGMTYNEADGADYSGYNDAPGNPPRPILSDNDHTTGFAITTSNGYGFADLLVIKAANIARNDTAQKWTYLATGLTKSWGVASEDPGPNDYAIVLSPGVVETDIRTLVTDSVGLWNPKFSAIPGSTFVPDIQDPQPRYLYGIVNGTAARMPFNRADYYISKTAVGAVPKWCAPNTGVLVKSMINHSNGLRADNLPLLDCVADMKVIFRLDRDADGSIDSNTDVLNDAIGTPLTAQQIREQLKEIRVYILAHQGQMEKTYTHPQTTIQVGEFNLHHNFTIGANVHYRWKVYTLAVYPKNMRQKT